MKSLLASRHVAVVIPCYRVAGQIASVLQTLPTFIRTIICVDDRSPDDTAEQIRRLHDPRVRLVQHSVNQGVGGAMVTGYREALRLGAEIIVKMDGDGQMDPAFLPLLLSPILRGEVDYTKGNRWRDVAALDQMPAVRRVGNLGLSFLVKLASGYWTVFDPCNGYTAIRAEALRRIDLATLARGYFFEISLLVRLNVARAVVKDIAMPARYGDEISSLKVGRIVRQFPPLLLQSFLHRFWRRHFVHDFGPVALFSVGSVALLLWAVGFGLWQWAQSSVSGQVASAGTVMLAALPFLMGFQLLLQSVVLDINDEPTEPIDDDAIMMPFEVKDVA